jgi:uncharacterized membrane protein
MKFRREIIATLAAVGALAALVVWGASSANCLALSARDAAVSVDVSGLARGDARTYCYTDSAGKRLRFVLARGTDGGIRTVFDACRQCFIYHRGFKYEHGELICRVCGNHYSVDRMTVGKASCVPVSLRHSSDDHQVVRIRVADLKAGRALF